MKKHLTYGSLLATFLSISLSCSSLTLKEKDTWPITEPTKAITQAILAAIETIPGKTSYPFIRFMKKYKACLAGLLGLLWLWLLARLHYINEKGRQTSPWQLDDLAFLKAIKDNAVRLWANQWPDQKILRLDDLK